MWIWIRQNTLQLLGPLFTLIGIGIGAAMVAWQLKRQHEGSLAVQRESKRHELRLQIYQSFVAKLNSVQDSIGEAWMYVFVLPGNIEMRAAALQTGQAIPVYKPLSLDQRAPKWAELHNRAHKGVAELMVELESWTIAFPDAERFQIGFHSATWDAREAFAPLFTFLLGVLPMEPPIGAPPGTNLIVHSLPSGNQLDQLKSLVKRYWMQCQTLGATSTI